jgi:4-alpha-glucanotransferase
VPLSGPDGRKLLLEDVYTDPMADALAEAMKQMVHPPV